MADNPMSIPCQPQQSTASPHLDSLLTPQQLAKQKGVIEKAALKVKKDAKRVELGSKVNY
jgi:hypothetical protein